MSANLCSGVYFIRNAASGTVVHVPGTSSSTSLVCSALDYDQAGVQLFEFKRWKDCFVITNVATKLAVDMAGGKGVDGSPIVAHKYHGHPNQQWYIQRKGDEKSTYHKITNVSTGTVMDLDYGALGNDTPVIGYKSWGTLNQQWEFIGATECMLGRQIQVPGPERLVEKIVPGPERVVEKVVPGPERVVVVMMPGLERVVEKEVAGPERVVERVVPGPERVVEKIVVKFEDSPDTLRELGELRAQILRAVEGWDWARPKVAALEPARVPPRDEWYD